MREQKQDLRMSWDVFHNAMEFFISFLHVFFSNNDLKILLFKRE
jgi:hypothetical protein